MQYIRANIHAKGFARHTAVNLAACTASHPPRLLPASSHTPEIIAWMLYPIPCSVFRNIISEP